MKSTTAKLALPWERNKDAAAQGWDLACPTCGSEREVGGFMSGGRPRVWCKQCRRWEVLESRG